jgi:membrane associated rhomboid family serine protease
MFIILPISHEQQTVQRLPWITFGLIAINIIVFFLIASDRRDSEAAMDQKYDQLITYYIVHPYLEFPENVRKFLNDSENRRIDDLNEASETMIDPYTREREQEELDDLANDVVRAINAHPFREYGYAPAKPRILGLFTCLFLHDGYFHLFGNMLFLYLAGCAIEDIWGRPLYIAFYLISGVVASLTFQIANSNSMSPLVGASGAIAGLMGAFLVRLAKTRIRFFYFILLLFKKGTFYAPAYIMLPLWLLQQIAYGYLYEGEGGVAFSAHIGGFVFGAIVAVVIKMTELEERYIAPSIEKKVSLEQNPLFLKGVQLAESKDYPGALIHLQKVVREDPNHFEAFMEMRRIAELTGDRKGYNRNMAGIFDLLLRNRDYDLFIDLYAQYKDHPFRDALPARTLLAIGLFFEEQGDFPAAITNLEALVETYNADPISMKAYSKLARLHLDKLNDRPKALEALRESYFHSQSTQDWRSALAIEMKKYGLTPEDLGSVVSPTQAAPKPTVPQAVPTATMERVAVASPPKVPQVSVPKLQPGAEPATLPSASFDASAGYGDVVRCKLEKIGLNGLILSNQSTVGQLPWKRIRGISVASLKELKPGNTMVIDLIVQSGAEQKRMIYRILGSELNFDRIFPRVEQSFDEGYQNLIGIILRNSQAKCFPDRNRVIGPNYLVFSSMSDYDSQLQQVL